MKKREKRDRPVIGWREWVALPGLGIDAVKAKVDTGARSSTLHAYDVEIIDRRDGREVRFSVHPFQRQTRTTITARAPLLEMRRVKSSVGQVTLRPVIETELEIGDERHTIELTLVNRDEMGFRMLLGRQAIRGRCVVDPGRSYVTGKRGPDGRPRRKKKRKENRHEPGDAPGA